MSHPLLIHEAAFWAEHPGAALAGVDEAGRGPLAGPVFAAAVILHPGQIIEGANDSKKQSETVGNHSVTYKIRTAQEIESEKRRKVLLYLRGTGLCYSAMTR